MTKKIARSLGAWLMAGLSSFAFAASMTVSFAPNPAGNNVGVVATLAYAGVAALGNGTQVVVCYDGTKLTFVSAAHANPPGESQPPSGPVEGPAGGMCVAPATRQILFSFVSFGTTWPSNPTASGTLAPAGNLGTINFTTANPFNGSTSLIATENTAAGGNYALGTTTGTLTKAITASTAVFSIGNVTVTEGGTGNAVVTCTGAFASNTIAPVTVAYTSTNGAGNFTTAASPVSFNACGTTQNILVTARADDTVIQGTVTGGITLGAVTTDTGSTVSPTASVVTVNDNDALPSVAITASGGCAEAVAPVNCTFTVTATSNTSPVQTVGAGPSVPFTIAGTATNGTDYKLVSGPAANCAAGPAFTGPVATTFGTPSVMTVCVIDDLIQESGGETVIVNLTANAAAYTLTTPSATNTIADDDSPQVVNVTVAGSPASENGGVLTYNFTRAGGSLPAQAAVLVANITPPASSPRYSTTCGATITFAANTATASCTVTGIDDILVNGAITVTVAVAPPTVVGAYTVGTSPAVGQLTDDDFGITVTAIAPAVNEGTAARFNLNCGGATGTFTVSYTITGADAGVVITPSATSASVTCTGGTSVPTVVTVPTINDVIIGNQRSVTLTLTGVARVGAPLPGSVVVGTPGAAVTVVLDDDVPLIVPTIGAFGLGLMSLMLIGLAAFQRRRQR